MERANKLQRACERIRAGIASGKPIQRTIHRVARALNGRPYRCDASRRLALSPKTLRRVWDGWRRGGEVPAAFKLNYFVRPSSVPAPVMMRFVQFCGDRPLATLAAAWRQFAMNCGPAVVGQKISLDRVYHYFPATEFRLMQKQMKVFCAALEELLRLRAQAAGSINRRLAARTPCRHKDATRAA